MQTIIIILLVVFLIGLAFTNTSKSPGLTALKRGFTVIIILAIAFVGYLMYRGYKAEQDKVLPLKQEAILGRWKDLQTGAAINITIPLQVTDNFGAGKLFEVYRGSEKDLKPISDGNKVNIPDIAFWDEENHRLKIREEIYLELGFNERGYTLKEIKKSDNQNPIAVYTKN